MTNETNETNEDYLNLFKEEKTCHYCHKTIPSATTSNMIGTLRNKNLYMVYICPECHDQLKMERLL